MAKLISYDFNWYFKFYFDLGTIAFILDKKKRQHITQLKAPSHQGQGNPIPPDVQ